MKRSKQFQPVVDVAEQREKQEAKRFGDCQRVLKDEQDKLAQLIQYRDEYLQRLETTGSAGMDIMRLRDYRAFLEKLNQAIKQQSKVIEDAEQACHKQRGNWLDKRSRAQALDKVAEKYRHEERHAENRREQKLSDEFAGRSRPPEEHK